jgi:hypothetical protein
MTTWSTSRFSVWNTWPHELSSVVTTRTTAASAGADTRWRQPAATTRPSSGSATAAATISAPAGGPSSGASTPTGCQRPAGWWTWSTWAGSRTSDHTTT